MAFIVGLEEFHKAVGKDSPSWVSQWRTRGLMRFKELGFPTTRQEEWKYTNVTPIAQRRFHFPVPDQPVTLPELEEYSSEEDVNIVFVDGLFSEEYSNLEEIPPGVRILNLPEAFLHYEKDIVALWKQQDSQDGNPFVALNKALLHHGAFIRIEPKAVVEKLIHIIHVTSPSFQETIDCPFSMIFAGASSEVKILESHVAFSKGLYFVDALTDILLEEDAKVFYGKAQKESPEAFHIGTTRIWQKRDSQLNAFCFTADGRLTRNDLQVVLEGVGSSAILNGLYSVRETQHVDNHTAVDHRVRNCTSNQFYKGILNDSGRAVFNGKIFVRREAQQTNSYQLNKNLLLGKGCRVDTKPQLEIFANDVKCTHGATIGQLNEDEVFYLQTRSIPKDRAVDILARGFVDEILNAIPAASVKQKLNTLLKDKFAQLA